MQGGDAEDVFVHVLFHQGETVGFFHGRRQVHELLGNVLVRVIEDWSIDEIAPVESFLDMGVKSHSYTGTAEKGVVSHPRLFPQ